MKRKHQMAFCLRKLKKMKFVKGDGHVPSLQGIVTASNSFSGCFGHILNFSAVEYFECDFEAQSGSQTDLEIYKKKYDDLGDNLINLGISFDSFNLGEGDGANRSYLSIKTGGKVGQFFYSPEDE